MSVELTKGIIVFFSYADRDKMLRDRLEEHLSILKYRGLITTWHDREIQAGADRARQVEAALQRSQIILLLISATFMASSYCYSVEMQQALQLHEQRKAVVIPVLLRPVLFNHAPFARLAALPANGRPVTQWRDRDRAFVDVALHIERVVEGYQRGHGLAFDSSTSAGTVASGVAPASTPPARRDGGRKCPACGTENGLENASCSRCGYVLFVPTVGVIPRVNSSSRAESWSGADPANTGAEQNLSFEESRRSYYLASAAACKQALLKNGRDKAAFSGLGKAFYALGNYHEALSAYESAVQIQPTPSAYAGLGNACVGLRRYGRAIFAYDEALRLDPDAALDYPHFIHALQSVGRRGEAEQVRRKAIALGYFDEGDQAGTF